MKNVFIITCLLLSVAISLSYAEKFVIIEQTTSADCTSCVERSEHLYDLIEKHPQKVTAVTYYKDLLTNSDSEIRVNYYGWGYIGSGKFNGRTPPNGVGELNPDDILHIDENTITEAYSEDAKFAFELNSTSTGTSPNHSCDLKVKATALVEYSSPGIIRMLVALIENGVDYQQSTGSAPGNGQQTHNYVCRKMLPTGNGSLITDQTIGKENNVNASYTNDDAKQNYEAIRVVAFIQDFSSKEIIGAFQSSTHPFQDITISDNYKTIQNEKNTSNRLKLLKITGRSIQIYLPFNGLCNLTAFSADGKQLGTLFSGYLKKGEQGIPWSLNGMAKGVYFLQLRFGNIKTTKKVIMP